MSNICNKFFNFKIAELVCNMYYTSMHCVLISSAGPPRFSSRENSNKDNTLNQFKIVYCDRKVP